MIALNSLSRSKLLKSWHVLNGNGGGFQTSICGVEEMKKLLFPKLGRWCSGTLDDFSVWFNGRAGINTSVSPFCNATLLHLVSIWIAIWTNDITAGQSGCVYGFSVKAGTRPSQLFLLAVTGLPWDSEPLGDRLRLTFHFIFWTSNRSLLMQGFFYKYLMTTAHIQQHINSICGVCLVDASRA